MEQGSNEMKHQGRYPEYTVYSHPIPQRALAMSSEYSYLTCSSTRLSTAIRKSTCPFEVPYISQLSGARRIVRIDQVSVCMPR